MSIRRLRTYASALCVACSDASQGVTPAPPIPPGPVFSQVEAVIAREEQRFIEVRRDLHRHPELSGEERRTAQVVRDALGALGLEVRSGIGGHGVTALLRGARPGPLVAYRADMDAVASGATDPVEFRSVNAGVRHICGHDIHVTVGLAVATALAQVRDSLAGSVLFVFQPAEERATGAKAMLAAGVFETALPAAIYGLHTAPYEAGRVASTPGPMMAGRDRFEVTVTSPDDIGNAASAVLARINALSTISAASLGISQPPDFILVNASAPQVSGTTARIAGSVVLASAASRARVRALIADELQRSPPAGAQITSMYESRAIAGVTNDTLLARAAMATARAVLGDANVSTVTTIPPAFSEDFGSFQERVPGVFFYLGVANSERRWNGVPHDANYVADERAISVGARLMSRLLLSHLLQ